MLRTNSIPILLLTGFLGTGKTSLLNHLLQNNQDVKIGVIVNDFGKVNIDAMLVSAQTDTTVELSNGCICCQIEGENLDDAIGQLAHRGSRLDYIIIEASGLAQVRELATTLRLLKNNYCHFDALIHLVDATTFDKDHPGAPKVSDLEITDIIIINKIDLITDKKLAEIKKGLNLAAPKARLLTTKFGQVDFRLLLDLESQPSAQLKLTSLRHSHEHEHHDHKHLHEDFTSIHFQTQKPLDWQKFETWAQNIPSNIFRAKGIIFFGTKGMEQKFIFQAVGSRYKIKLDEWGLNQTPQTDLVVIGLELDEKKVLKELEDLIDKTPDEINAQTLMDIFRYK